MKIYGNSLLGQRELLDSALAGRAKLLQDVRNKVMCFTITMKPINHGICPTVLKKMMVDGTKNFVCKTRTGLWIQLHYEFTLQGILHAHCFSICRPSRIYEILAFYRKTFGFVLVKNPTGIGNNTLQGWLSYINDPNPKKEVNVYRASVFYVAPQG